jgi:hypothetical protein
MTKLEWPEVEYQIYDISTGVKVATSGSLKGALNCLYLYNKHSPHGLREIDPRYPVEDEVNPLV